MTAVEGRFAVRNKMADHPHTNMAKAALNMLTRTSAAELAEQARVYDPIVRGKAGDPVSGVFLKDYREAKW